VLKAKILKDGVEKEIEIPQSWHEVTYKLYHDLIITGDVAEAITGYKTSEIEPLYVELFYERLKFLKSEKKLKKAVFIPEWAEKINIAKEQWGKLEKAKQLIKNNEGKKDELLAEGIFKEYAPEVNVFELSVVEVIGALSMFFQKITDFFKKHDRLNDYTPDPDEVRAGVGELERYGYFPTLMSLCGDDPLKYDEMLKQPAGVIYMTLLVKFEQSQIQKKLYEIKSKRK
jgi:hypothetical protein